MKGIPSRKYTKEFREGVVEQVLNGRSVTEVANGMEMPPKTLANWVAIARRGEGLCRRRDGNVNELEAENSRLRRENALLKIDRELLKKAAAFFAKESA